VARSRRAVPAPSDSKPSPSPSPPQLQLVEGRLLRWEKIRTARARVAAGFYDREDVRSRLADAVLRRMRRP